MTMNSMSVDKAVEERRRCLRRASSLVVPDVRNPFVHHLNLRTLDKIKIGILSVTLMPIRVILVVVFLPFVYLICRIALLALSHKQYSTEPLRGWRRALQFVAWFIGRFQFFLMGFHYVSVKGTRSSREQAPIAICGPHTGLFDILIVFVLGLPYTNTVSREENGQALFAGALVRLLQPIFVSRKDPNSRQNALHEIQRRAQPGSKWPQIFMFPEGTCTNRSCLVNFKPGAFSPGLPVQPVALHFKNKPDTVVWTCGGPQVLASLLLTMCNFNNTLEIEFLPVYKPNEKERKDPILFAQNVRNVLARALDLPTTDHSFEDTILMRAGQRYGMPLDAAVVEYNKIMTKLGVNLSDMKEQLPKYAEIARSKGYINIEDFAHYLNLPVSPALEEVFAMYDRDGSGYIDFREYIIGCCLIAKPTSKDEETLSLAYKRFNEEGCITREKLLRIVENSNAIIQDQAEELFYQVDEEKNGLITYGTSAGDSNGLGQPCLHKLCK